MCTPSIVVWFFIVQIILVAILFVLNFYVYKFNDIYKFELLEIYAYILSPTPFVGAVAIIVLFILLLLKIKWHKQK